MHIKQMSLAEAVERAIDKCIKEWILSDFLKKNRAKVISVSIFEFDEERYYQILKEEGREEGEDRMNRLYSILFDSDRLDDLKRATKDKVYQEQLMCELLPEEILNI